MHRQPDSAGLVQNGVGDGLLDPLGSVGRKLVALFVVEAKHGPHEPQVAFLNQVGQGQTSFVRKVYSRINIKFSAHILSTCCKKTREHVLGLTTQVSH